MGNRGHPSPPLSCFQNRRSPLTPHVPSFSFPNKSPANTKDANLWSSLRVAQASVSPAPDSYSQPGDPTELGHFPFSVGNMSLTRSGRGEGCVCGGEGVNKFMHWATAHEGQGSGMGQAGRGKEMFPAE